jgi:hypothetical protein
MSHVHVSCASKRRNTPLRHTSRGPAPAAPNSYTRASTRSVFGLSRLLHGRCWHAVFNLSRGLTLGSRPQQTLKLQCRFPVNRFTFLPIDKSLLIYLSTAARRPPAPGALALLHAPRRAWRAHRRARIAPGVHCIASLKPPHSPPRRGDLYSMSPPPPGAVDWRPIGRAAAVALVLLYVSTCMHSLLPPAESSRVRDSARLARHLVVPRPRNAAAKVYAAKDCNCEWVVADNDSDGRADGCNGGDDGSICWSACCGQPLPPFLADKAVVSAGPMAAAKWMNSSELSVACRGRQQKGLPECPAEPAELLPRPHAALLALTNGTVCTTCGHVRRGANCCRRGGSWFGLCGRHGRYSFRDGFLACNDLSCPACGNVRAGNGEIDINCCHKGGSWAGRCGPPSQGWAFTWKVYTP